LDEHLEELGITEGGRAAGSNEKVVVFSQFVAVIRMLRHHLESKDIRIGEISGRVSAAQRNETVKEFQDTAGDMNVILVSTTAGGVSIELDAADEVVFLDETWSHADMEQAEDRVHRANRGRTKQVNVYKLRTDHTVETEIVMPKVINKRDVSNLILDVRRGIEES
jgi:SNF2 family DNA or RNA helicase